MSIDTNASDMPLCSLPFGPLPASSPCTTSQSHKKVPGHFTQHSLLQAQHHRGNQSTSRGFRSTKSLHSAELSHMLCTLDAPIWVALTVIRSSAGVMRHFIARPGLRAYLSQVSGWRLSLAKQSRSSGLMRDISKNIREITTLKPSSFMWIGKEGSFCITGRMVGNSAHSTG